MVSCRLFLVYQEFGPLCSTLSLLFVLNQLTPFWNALCVEPLFRPVLRLLPQVVRAYHGVNIQFMV